MKKYYVTLECITHHTVEVEANSFDEACEKANVEQCYEEVLPIHAECEDGSSWDI